MRTLAPLIALAFLTTGCGPVDADGDGVPSTLDCDDTKAAIYPGATEICDGIDNDCNAVIDDDYARGGQIFFLDRDGDGAGVWELAQVRCSQPVGYVDNADDCADDDADVYPGAPEFCDRIDQDCNGKLDNDPVDGTPYYTDLDGDGYGGISSVVYSCEPEDGYITVGGDCDDFNDIIGPEAIERCNDIDDDCNGVVDDATSEGATVWYADKDGDGYGSADDTTTGCNQPEYYVAEDLRGDCDDSNADVNPEAREVCNDGVDNNCNDSADACSYSNWAFEEGGMTRISGQGSSAYFGRDVSIVGDVNGDGFDDIVTGGYRAGGGSCSGSYCGGGILIYGRADIADDELTKADGVYYTANSSYEYAGIAVAGLGDLNNDGYADFGLGSYGNGYNASYSGAVYVVYGGPNMPTQGADIDMNSVGMLYGTTRSSSYLGYSLTGADVDGDGYSDVVAGASRGYHDGLYTGKIFVRYGGAEKLAFEGVDSTSFYYGQQSYEYPGSQTGHGLGDGDFNADGIADMLIGSYQYDHRGQYGTGRAYVILGDGTRVEGAVPLAEASDTIINGTTNYGYFGQAATGVGDTNGDGYEDMGFCAYGESSYAGRCYVLLGSAEPELGSVDQSSVDFAVYLEGYETYDYLGQYGMGSGDFDGDGKYEVLAGGHYYQPDSTTYSAGSFGVVPGAESHEDAKYRLGDRASLVSHNVRYAYFGAVGAESGDINGDGYDDALIGAYGASGYAGEAYIFFGGGL